MEIKSLYMKRILVFSLCFLLMLSNLIAQPVLSTGGKEMPNEWIDSATGHRVLKLTRNKNTSNLSFYFHNNPFIGNKMVYYSSDKNNTAGVAKQETFSVNSRNKQLHLLDLKTLTSEQLTFHQKPMNGEIVHAKSGNVFYQIQDTVFSVNANTRKTNVVYVFKNQYRGSVAAVNANGKYLAGVRVEEKEREILRNNPQKSSYFNLIYEAKLPRALFIIDTEKGTLKEIHTDSAWLNHVQFSTTDPDLLMFCHEGPWHKVDRIWTIRLSTQQTMLMHKRSMPNEIAGHEWSSPDGKIIWFDLQQPRSTTFFVAGADVKTGKEIKYSLKREEWSIHFNLSNNQQLFCGDGADPGQVAKAQNAQWIYLFRPNGDHFDAEKLVDMKHHGYKLEPNVHFSPDDKWVIFRANFEGIENVYAVEILPAVKTVSLPSNGWPAITQTMKPWTRWWWQGSAVNGKDLDWNLEQFQKAGLGGVEITPIYGAIGHEKEYLQFLSPAWMNVLTHTLKKSKSLDLGVDLANATGWPFGGPWVSDQDASKSVFHKIYTVTGGVPLKEKIEYRREAWVRTANPKPLKSAQLLDPPSSNKDLQGLALDQVQFAGSLPLEAVVAYSDQGESVELMDKVDKSGTLNWNPPQGNWKIYAIFSGLHGKMVERAAPGGEGYAIDHFSKKAAVNYFKKFDTPFVGHDLSYLRGFFNDSYEVDDARGQANWTNDMFSQFQKIKGYDLRSKLPALFGNADKELNSRVLYDYRSVIDEMILNNFTKEWKKWGDGKQKILRNQSHGSPANTLDLYSVVDIPETEGTDVLRFKFASSAANVSGKQLVSAESATWLNEHFLSSWGDVKKAIDLYFLGGVNHIVYHGTAYSPKNAPWPGWLFYAAVHFQPVNPQWKDFHVLNNYIAKVQSFLQQGKPNNDLLVYYPIVDRYAQTGGPLLQHFDGMEKNFEHTDFEHVSQHLQGKGIGFDFFSDRQLQLFESKGKSILSAGNTYQTIVLPAIQQMDASSLSKIMELAKQGATIIAYKQMPKGVPGFSNLEARQKAFDAILTGLKFTEAGKLQTAAVGKGKLIIAADMESLSSLVSVYQRPFEQKGFQSIQRELPDGHVVFINNRTEKPLDEWVNIPVNAKTSLSFFDPMSGKITEALTRSISSTQVAVRIALGPHESILLRSSTSPMTSPKHQYPSAVVTTVPISGPWKLEFLEGGPQLPRPVSLDSTGFWTSLADTLAKNFSGTARYSTSFVLPDEKISSWTLSLGEVSATVELVLNGVSLGSHIGPVFNFTIPANLLKKENKLQITVASLMANRIAYMDRNNLLWKIFYNVNMPARRKENARDGIFSAADWPPVHSGLKGPVVLKGNQ